MCIRIIHFTEPLYGIDLAKTNKYNLFRFSYIHYSPPLQHNCRPREVVCFLDYITLSWREIMKAVVHTANYYICWSYASGCANCGHNMPMLLYRNNFPSPILITYITRLYTHTNILNLNLKI